MPRRHRVVWASKKRRSCEAGACGESDVVSALEVHLQNLYEPYARVFRTRAACRVAYPKRLPKDKTQAETTGKMRVL